MPPSIRGTPKRLQKTPNTASDAAILTSHQIANSSPPTPAAPRYQTNNKCITTTHHDSSHQVLQETIMLSANYIDCCCGRCCCRRHCTHQPLQIPPQQQSLACSVVNELDPLGPGSSDVYLSCQLCFPHQQEIVNHIQHKNSPQFL